VGEIVATRIFDEKKTAELQAKSRVDSDSFF